MKLLTLLIDLMITESVMGQWKELTEILKPYLKYPLVQQILLG